MTQSTGMSFLPHAPASTSHSRHIRQGHEPTPLGHVCLLYELWKQRCSTSAMDHHHHHSKLTARPLKVWQDRLLIPWLVHQPWLTLLQRLPEGLSPLPQPQHKRLSCHWGLQQSFSVTRYTVGTLHSMQLLSANDPTRHCLRDINSLSLQHTVYSQMLTSNPWVVKLSWLANAYSGPLLWASDLDE